jgi:hypothetical protein
MSRADWKPGWVTTISQGLVRIAVGQHWGYFPDKTAFGDVLLLTVVAISPEGEVSFKARDAALLEKMFPVETALFKGKPVVIRGNKCPFDWTRNKEGVITAGYLLAHEGWSLWDYMHLYTAPPEGV